MAKKKGRKPPPKCKAILLCDQTIIDAVTKKTSLIGVFDSFICPGFPGHTSLCTAYVQLVDGIGKYTLTVEIHDLSAGNILAKGPAVQIEFPQRVNKTVMMIAVPPVLLPHAGAYDFVVFADGQEIDRQRFEALLPRRKTDDENEDEQ